MRKKNMILNFTLQYTEGLIMSNYTFKNYMIKLEPETFDNVNYYD